jgi:transcriptional regulator with XRE-family HTH domain
MLKEFGNDLKKLRESKGISLAEISAESRINPKFLQLIENGVFDFQPEAYIRSFIKEYARSLDENEHQLLNEYDKAKAGFYSKKKFQGDEEEIISLPDDKLRIKVTEQPLEESVYSQGIRHDKPDYYKQEPIDEDPPRRFSARSVTQKILLVVLFLAIAGGIYFLVDYLNSSGDKKTNVKPKTFNEISSEYENKIAPKVDSNRIKDSLKTLASADSLRLMVKALRDIRIKVYVDEQEDPIDEEIYAKDSLLISAVGQFRFSANANSSVELYLNGKYLRKPASLSGGSIKNLIINKEGILTQ